MAQDPCLIAQNDRDKIAFNMVGHMYTIQLHFAQAIPFFGYFTTKIAFARSCFEQVKRLASLLRQWEGLVMVFKNNPTKFRFI